MEPNYFTTVDRMEEISARLLKTAEMLGIDTWEDRKKAQTPSCRFGDSGICCRICSMGPCRITPKSPKGICGATADAIAGRNYLRMVAAGAATHSDHGREICRVLYNADPNGSYKITDVAKLEKIAKEWGIATEGRDIYEVAKEVAYTGLMEYGKPFGELKFLERANDERKKVWKEQDVMPGAVDKEVVKAMHMTHMGNTADAEALVRQGLRTGMSDGWGGSMMGTEFSDVLFGTPMPKDTEAFFGVLEKDMVNIIVHGHDPAMSEMVVQASEDRDLLELARKVGAKGINVCGLCCTANEVAMRRCSPASLR